MNAHKPSAPSTVLEKYPPPSDAVRICIYVSGLPQDKDKIKEIVMDLLQMYKMEIAKIEFPEKPTQNMPDEVNTWIANSGLRIVDGKLV